MSKHESLAEALAAFQAELPSVSKNATGQVPGKRSYKYADLADLSASVLPTLAKHGLSWTTMPTHEPDGRFVLRYELIHTSGESRTGTYPLPSGTAWEIGSALTYARRYCLAAVTGVAADEDDDGAAAQQARPGTQQRRQEPPKPSPADEARDRLRGVADEHSWSLQEIADRFATEHAGVTLRAATDPDVINAFTMSLLADDSLAGAT